MGFKEGYKEGFKEGYKEDQAALQASVSSTAGVFGDDEEEVPDQNKKKKKKGFDFLQWIFGWIIDPITAIIEGIISLVKFVINSIKFCINLPWCFKWYLFYMIGTILYLPLALLFMFFGLQKIEKKIWKAKNDLHNLIVCYTGYSIISYSDEIRDGCFFETIKKRKCPKASMPNAGLSEIFAELFDGLFSFSYIAVVTSLSFFLFILLFIYYFVKPLMVRLYTFLISSAKQTEEPDIPKNVSEAIKNIKKLSSSPASSSNLLSKLSNPLPKLPTISNPLSSSSSSSSSSSMLPKFSLTNIPLSSLLSFG